MKQGKHYTTVILWIFIFLAHRAADHRKCH